MRIFTKMANIVRINKMAKRSPLKVAILPKMANLAKTMKIAKIHQSLRKS